MKKIVAGIFSFVMCLFVLTGCNLIELNKSKFYNQVAVELVTDSGHTVKNFLLEDLLNTYNNFGYQFMQQENANSKDALNSTAELMVQRYMLVNEIKKTIQLTKQEKNELKKETYKYINGTLKEIETKIRVEWDRTLKDPENKDEEKKPLRDAFKEYKPTVERVFDENGFNATLQRVKDDKITEDVVVGDFIQDVTDEDVSQEAMKRYLKQLKENNENLGKKVAEKDLLQTEIDKIYSLLEENKYIAKYQEEKLKTLEIQSDKVVESYKAKYLRDYEKFANNKDAYYEAMKNDSQNIYYHYNGGNEFMYVTHILFKFSDEQTKEIEKLKNMLKSNSIEQKVYDARMEEITRFENLKVTYEENGEKHTISAQEALNDLMFNVNNYDANNHFESRAKEFNKFIYKYNDDPGIMNKDFAYVVTLNEPEKDTMVKEFANEARDLYSKGLGAMSDKPIKTEYGYHILFNLGAVTNVLEKENINNLTWQALYNRKTQPALEKTLFHFEYDNIKCDELDNNKVSLAVSNKISDLLKDLTIKYHEKTYLKLIKEK